MKQLDGFHRQTPEEYLNEIDLVLKANSSFYEKARLRSAIGFEKGVWVNKTFSFQAFPKGEAPKPEKSRRYNNFCLLEDWIPVNDIREFIKSWQSKKIIIDGTDVILDEQSKFSFISYLSGLNEYSKHPGLLVQSEQGYLHDNGVPLIEWDLPAYPTFYAAASDWIFIKEFGDWPRASTMNKFYIFLPECRAWIKEIKLYGKKTFRFLFDLVGDCPRLKLKGFWKVDKKLIFIDHLVKTKVFYLKVPPGEINNLYFYLIDEEGNIFDYYDETHSSNNRSDILLQVKNRPSLKKLILSARLVGESGKLELKPYIDLKNQKVDELVETVIGFANAEGGTILIGVNKKGVIEGIENRISPNPKKMMKELASYIGQIRSLISEYIGKELEIRTTPVKIGRNTVLAIEVMEGPQKPYMFSRDGKCFIRRGASNMPASAEAIQKMGQSDLFRNLGSE